MPIVLSGEAVAAWKAGGEQWRTWGWRIIKVTSGSGTFSRIHINSCYAPIFAADREDKDNFFDNLHQALNEVPLSKAYVVLGDFNARV